MQGYIIIESYIAVGYTAEVPLLQIFRENLLSISLYRPGLNTVIFGLLKLYILQDACDL